ncbi:MAG: HDOD domain-containing protein [Nitrosomonadales bacterium]|nr:HDOD domain-containing protein [Nitrosomonadales bacterium]
MPAVTQDEVLSRLHKLPAMPLVIQEVVASFGDDNLDTSTLAHKIAQDQGLSAKMLRVANSPFYGLPRRIGSVQDAIVVMGFANTRSLALAAGMMGAFPQTAGSPFDRGAFWRRSFRVAGYAQALADCLRQGQPMAFTAGMFHDIGQLVLDVCIPEQFAAVLQEHKASGLDLIEAEQSRFGFDHALIGAEVARRWNFPPEIEQAIRYWRTPEHEPFDPVTGVVHVAALLESGRGGEDLMAHLPENLSGRLKLSWERIRACLPGQDQLDAVSDLMLEG